MRESTINKYLNLIEEAKQSGLSLRAFCKQKGYSYEAVNKFLYKYRKEGNNISTKNNTIEDIKEDNIKDSITQEVDNDERAETNILRDQDGKIQYYEYIIYRKDKTPLTGKFSRDEMATIYRLYSYYGDSLTQRTVARHFPDLSLVDFRRILRAFGIYKSSSPFPRHFYEEYSEEELEEIQLREKENSFLRKIEEKRIRDTENLLKEYAERNINLQNQLDSLSSIKVDLSNISIANIQPSNVESDKSIMLHLSDMHIGSKILSGSLYDTKWNKEELSRRLTEITKRVAALGPLNTIILNILGDSLDGMDNMTARRDHLLPQDMDNMEQVTTYINSMIGFISSLIPLCKNLKIYCVPCGNHGGITEQVANIALLSSIKQLYPNIYTKLFDKFYGYYECNGYSFLIMHGKDESLMKKPLPLNLNADTKVKLYEYINSIGKSDKFIHVIKGDLHTENINSCYHLDYRNVLSLFGASSHSEINYQRNQYGISYELFIGDIMTRGTFENI